MLTRIISDLNIMKIRFIFLLIFFNYLHLGANSAPKEIFKKSREVICLVSFYQNISSDSKIGSFDKIKKYHIGILVNPSGLVMVSNEVYPVSLDFISHGGSLLSGLPTEFQVIMADGQEYPAEFLGKDDQAMVAFIQINKDKVKKDFAYLPFHETSHLGVQDTVYILELLPQNYRFSPVFTSHTINALISSPRRKFLINNYSPALSAGGLVLDTGGQAVGMVINQTFDFATMGPGDFEDYQKKFLEIAPSEWFSPLIQSPPNLQANQITQNSWLGIQMQALTRELKEYWQVPQEGGVVINQVFAESPAEKAKLQVGDIILAVEDSILEITKDEETARLRNIILSFSPGSIIDVKIFRNNKIVKRRIQLTAAPKAIGLAEKYPVPQLGFEVRELTRDILYQENLPLNTPGVFVFQVDRASPAGIGGLEIGDIVQEINGEKIQNLTDAREIISRSQDKSRQMYMLKILSRRATGYVFLDLRK